MPMRAFRPSLPAVTQAGHEPWAADHPGDLAAVVHGVLLAAPVVIEHQARAGDLNDLGASVTKLRAQRTVALSELEALESAPKVA